MVFPFPENRIVDEFIWSARAHPILCSAEDKQPDGLVVVQIAVVGTPRARRPRLRAAGGIVTALGSLNLFVVPLNAARSSQRDDPALKSKCTTTDGLVV